MGELPFDCNELNKLGAMDPMMNHNQPFVALRALCGELTIKLRGELQLGWAGLCNRWQRLGSSSCIL